MKSTRIAVLGAAGRMGRAVITAVQANAQTSVTRAFERNGAAEVGRDAGELAGLDALGVTIGDQLNAPAPDYDVLIDFTRPEATLAALDACVAQGRGMVIGTTGFTQDQLSRIDDAAKQIAIVKAGNFSLGINLCMHLVEQAARTLGAAFDIEVIEAHHKHKVDAPSGTALMLGEAAAQGAGIDMSKDAVYERYGQTGARPAGSIGFSTVRGGDVVGEHSVLFLGEGERVEITHKASSRMNFANGAVRAAAWVAARKPGLYDMRDVVSTP